MIILLHGDNQILSRNKLSFYISQAKEKKTEIIIRDGSKLTLEEARNILESSSFFGGDRLSVWENFLSSTKSKDKDKILNYLKQSSVNVELILWEGKAVKDQKEIKFDKIEFFKIPSLLFKFLDLFRPETKQRCLTEFEKLLKSDGEEMIFHMLVRQIRLLLMVSDNYFDDIAFWQKGKMILQAKSFKKGQLLKIYQNLLAIDHDQKTSQTIEPLSARLEVLISSL